MLESRKKEYAPINRVPVETVTNCINDKTGVLGYIHSLSPEEFNSQFLHLQKRLRENLETKSCDRVGEKNRWQGELIQRLSMDDDSQQMAHLASNYGHQFSMLYCSLNCPEPCTMAREGLQKMYQMYQFVAPQKFKYLK